MADKQSCRETRPLSLLQSALDEASDVEEKGDEELAVGCWVKATALTRIVHGDRHWKFAACHIHVARCYQDLQGLYDQALLHASTGRDILLTYLQSLREDMPREALLALARSHYIIGSVLMAKMQLGEAESSLLKAEKVLQQWQRKHCEEEEERYLAMRIAWARGRLAMKTSKTAMAERCLEKALELSKALPSVSQSEFTLLQELSEVAVLKEEYSEALRFLKMAEELAMDYFEDISEERANVLLRTAQVLLGKREEESTARAEELLDKAHDMFVTVHTLTYHKALACKEELLKLYLHELRHKDAVMLMKELIPRRLEAHGELSVEVARAHKTLGSIYLITGDITSATTHLKKAQSILSVVLGSSHSETREISSNLDTLSGSRQQQKPRFNQVF